MPVVLTRKKSTEKQVFSPSNNIDVGTGQNAFPLSFARKKTWWKDRQVSDSQKKKKSTTRFPLSTFCLGKQTTVWNVVTVVVVVAVVAAAAAVVVVAAAAVAAVVAAVAAAVAAAAF